MNSWRRYDGTPAHRQSDSLILSGRSSDELGESRTAGPKLDRSRMIQAFADGKACQ